MQTPTSTHTKPHICDRGHPESPHSDITRGYGTNADGATLCYDCCLEQDKAIMRQTGKYTLYLVIRDGRYIVSNWPGTLEFPATGKKSWHNFAGTRTDVWFRFEGQLWHGYSIGNFTQICHCKKTKG